MTEYQKLTSYFGERQRSGGAFVADALLELYGRHEIAASILLRGTEGFGLKHHLRTDRSLSLSEDLPLVAVAVDTRPRIEAVLGPALALTPAGLVTVEGARLLADTAAQVRATHALVALCREHGFWGIQFDSVTNCNPAFNPAFSVGPCSINPNFLNVDLTATADPGWHFVG